jgi:hypothetical protein
VDDLAGVDADPQLEGSRLQTEAGVQLLDRADERETGSNRALGIVVAGTRRAEHGHDGVADELLDHAAVPRDRVAGR